MTAERPEASSTPETASSVRPDHAFLLVALVFGVALAVLVPPFQVPDEPQHFYRAFQVSELGLLVKVIIAGGQRRDAFTPGALLPKSLAALVDSSDVRTTRFRPDRKVSPSKFLGELHTPLNAHDREYLPVARYPPAGYLPQALGIAVGRMLGASALVLFYLGRFCSLGFSIALILLAIRITPILKWTYFLLAVMPMSLHLAASNSVDGVVISASFLLSAQLLAWAYDPDKVRVTARDCAWFLVPAGLLALSKSHYLLALPLLVLVPWRKFGSRTRYALSLIAIVAACLALNSTWERLTVPTTLVAGEIARHAVDAPRATVEEQSEFVRAQPLTFLKILAATFYDEGRGYLVGFVGRLGWIDTRIPVWVPYVYALVLVVVSSLKDAPVRVSWKAKCLSAGIFGSMLLAAQLPLYMAMNPVGARVVVGFQGRYLIPIAPLLLLTFHNQVARRRVTNAGAFALIGFVALALSLTSYRVVQRFYLAQAPALSLAEPADLSLTVASAEGQRPPRRP